MHRHGAFVISGAGGGIGRAIAAELIARGHVVFAFGRDEAKLRRSADDLGLDRYGFAAVDLSDPAGVARGVRDARAWLGDRPLLGLVNNAGIFTRGSFDADGPDAWTSYFDNNLMSAVRLTHAFYPDLRAAKPSSVLNVSSTLGQRPVAGTVAYSALKAAMNNWTAGLAIEWAPDGIRVNAICPGIVDTPIHDFGARGGRAEADALHPLGRVGTSTEVARAAAFLLSEDSAWTTGSVLTVDGGISL